MNLTLTQIPVWISILFIISFTVTPVYLIIKAFNTTESPKGLKQKIILFYSIFFLATAVLSLYGFYFENAIPPRILIFAAIPLFVFYIFYVKNATWFKLFFEQVNIEDIILIHLFRFVGVFFLVAYFYGALPKQFAYIGGYGDIVSAFLAIPLYFAFKTKNKYAIPMAWCWSAIGLIDIFSVLLNAMALTIKAIENNTEGVQQMATFPLSWIPAFAPATIIFLHILIIKKLLKAKETNI